MQIQHLAYFIAVAQTKHFTRAAELMGVAQPTLSKQVRALEKSLGTPLFSRDRSGIELTVAGEALLPHARRILIESTNATRSVEEVSRLQRGRVRIGATPSMCNALLPEVLTGFHRQHGRIDLELHEAGSRDLTHELAEGRLDLALLIMPLVIADPDIETTDILIEELVLASPPERRRADTISITDLADLQLVMFREGYDLRDTTLGACAKAGFEPPLALEGGEMASVLRFVQAGLGHAVLPESVARNRAGVHLSRIVDPPLNRTVAVAHRRLDTLPLAAQAFRAFLVEHVSEAAS